MLYAERMNVELRHLRALVTLAESDSFTTAAAILDTTQPTLSRTIQQLEKITKTQLVRRTTRELSFTRRGEELVNFARELLASLDQTIEGFQAEAESPLRLGWAWAGFGKHTVPLLQEWKNTRQKGLELSRPKDPLAALQRERIDAALVRFSEPLTDLPDGLTLVSLYTEQFVAAIASSDPRSQQPAVSLADLATDTLAVCRTAPTATAALWTDLDGAPRTISVAGTDEWLTYIALGDAVGVTAEATTFSYRSPEVVYLPIEDAPAVEVALAFPERGQHPQAASFAEFAREYFTMVIASRTPPFIFSGES